MREELLKKFAEDDRLEQLNEQKRRVKARRCFRLFFISHSASLACYVAFFVEDWRRVSVQGETRWLKRSIHVLIRFTDFTDRRVQSATRFNFNAFLSSGLKDGRSRSPPAVGYDRKLDLKPSAASLPFLQGGVGVFFVQGGRVVRDEWVGCTGFGSREVTKAPSLAG